MRSFSGNSSNVNPLFLCTSGHPLTYYSVILSVLDPRKYEYFKDYSLHLNMHIWLHTLLHEKYVDTRWDAGNVQHHCPYMHVQNLMNSLRDISIFLGLVPKESPCIFSNDHNSRTNSLSLYAVFSEDVLSHNESYLIETGISKKISGRLNSVKNVFVEKI
jgi:hypothetical protein